MIEWRRNLFFIWLSQILSLAGFGTVIPFIPLYMKDVLHILNDGERGVWVSAFYFAGQISFCIAMPVWGMLADRFGRRVMLLRANFVSALLVPFMALAPNVLWLVFLRFLISIFSGTVNAAQTLVGTTTPEDHQGFALGTLSTALWTGNMVGYLTGGLVMSHFGYTAAFLSGGVLLGLAGFLVLFFVKEEFHPLAAAAAAEVRRSKPRRTIRSMWAHFSFAVWILLGFFVFLGFVRKFDDPFVAMQVELIHGSADAAYWTGIICATAAVSGIFSGMFLGWLCDRFSPEKVAIPAALLSGLLMFPQGAASGLWMFGSARFFNYFFAGGLDPVFLTIVSRVTPADKRGEVFGWSASAKVAGSLLSSVAAGFLIYYYGVRWIFYVGGICFLLLIPGILFLFRILSGTRPET